MIIVILWGRGQQTSNMSRDAENEERGDDEPTLTLTNSEEIMSIFDAASAGILISSISRSAPVTISDQITFWSSWYELLSKLPIHH